MQREGKWQDNEEIERENGEGKNLFHSQYPHSLTQFSYYGTYDNDVLNNLIHLYSDATSISFSVFLLSTAAMRSWSV